MMASEYAETCRSINNNIIVNKLDVFDFLTLYLIHNRDASTRDHTDFIFKGRRILGKGREFPIQAWTDPSGCRRLRLSEFCRQSAHVGSKICKP